MFVHQNGEQNPRRILNKQKGRGSDEQDYQRHPTFLQQSKSRGQSNRGEESQKQDIAKLIVEYDSDIGCVEQDGGDY